MEDKKKVGLLKRIAAGVCAFMMVLGCLESDLFFAIEYGMQSGYFGKYDSSKLWVSSDAIVDYTLPVDTSEKPYYLIIGDDYGFVYYCLFDDVSKFYISCDDAAMGICSDVLKNCGASTYYFYKSGGWTTKSSGSGTSSYPITFCNGASMYYNGICILDANFDMYANTGELVYRSSVSTSGGIYNSSLGYLQNVAVKYLTIQGDISRVKSKYKFTFDTKSTSGIDLTSGDYSIKVYEQMSIYKFAYLQDFDTPKVLIGEYDAGGGSFDFNISEALEKTDAGTGDVDGYNMFTIALNGYQRSDTYWLQIYNKSTGEYGGFVKVSSLPGTTPPIFSAETVVASGDDITGSGDRDNDGYVDSIVNGSTGNGTNYDDAELNADNNASNSNSGSDFLSEINDMVSMVSAVPQLFGSLFSFLPDWCINLLGAGVGFSVVLLIWKSARG